MAKAATKPTPVLRLDRSKKFSTVHGDRVPDDPLNNVHFFQDGLPFDARGILVPDDGKTQPWSGHGPDGLPTRYHPLYSDEMRKKADRKLERLAKGAASTDDDPEDEVVYRDEVADDVNLESWLRGEAQYEPFIIYAACKKRYAKNYTKLRDVVEDLVFDERIIPEAQVSPNLMRLVERAQ